MRPALPWLALFFVLFLTALSLEAPLATAGQGTALDEYFKGRVVALDGKTVTLRYDFKDEGQLEDWTEGVFFRITKVKDQRVRFFDQCLELVGNVAVRHRGVWRGDLDVRARFVIDAERDLGAGLVPEPETEEIATFTLAETYFHKWDGSAGGSHSILKFGKQFRERGSTSDFVGFRYVARRPPPMPMTPGRKLDFHFGLKRGKLFMDVDGTDFSGKDMGVRLKRMHPAFYTVEGRMLVDDVVIRGRLDPKWLKDEGLDLRVATPIPADGMDDETRALVDGYATGATAASVLIEMIADATRPEPARKAAAVALGAGSRGVVPAVVDLLYNPDRVARQLGIEVVKALLGKSYGYQAKAKEKARSAAIRKLNEDLKSHPELLRDGD